jgi:hypothetical protein
MDIYINKNKNKMVVDLRSRCTKWGKTMEEINEG